MKTNAEMQMRMDADFGIFVERQLEERRAKSYDVKFPALKARQFIPVDNTVNRGAETVEYKQYTMAGLAKLISSYAEDLPEADVQAKEFRAAVKSMGTSYSYTLQEMRAAQMAAETGGMAGKPLEQRRADAARRAFEELVDSIGAKGDSANGLQGFLGITNALTYTPSTKGAGGLTWAVATGVEMLKDLNQLSVQSMNQTNDIEQPDTIVMPRAQFNLIATTPLFTSGGTTTTVLKQFLENTPFIKNVEVWIKTKGAGAGGTDRIVCYRKDPDALLLVIPQEFESLPYQPVGLRFKIPCHGRIAGVQCFYPLSVCYMDGT